MSDLDKLFENAPEDATEIVAWPGYELHYATATHVWWTSYGQWEERTIGWKTIATRPQPRKTVEDAVKYHNEVWPSTYNNAIAFNPSRDVFGNYKLGNNLNEQWYHVCNQSEFEACVAAKVKSEPEWAHEYCGERCKIQGEEDCFGRVVILTESGAYFLDNPSALKPIKPTITKAEAWDKVKSMYLHEGKSYQGAHKEILNKYEVVE